MCTGASPCECDPSHSSRHGSLGVVSIQREDQGGLMVKAKYSNPDVVLSNREKVDEGGDKIEQMGKVRNLHAVGGVDHEVEIHLGAGVAC